MRELLKTSMSRIILFCLFVGINGSVKAQIPLLSMDKEWIYSSNNASSIIKHFSMDTFMIKDTILYGCAAINQPCFKSLFREHIDTINGVHAVYVRIDKHKEEYLAYDFKLELHDTTTLYAFKDNDTVPCSQQFVVKSVDSLELNDGTKRKGILLGSGSLQNVDRIIEGIGSENEFSRGFDVCNTGSGSISRLRCFFSDGHLIYSEDPNEEDCFLANIQSLSYLNSTISPMPLTASSTIQIPGTYNWEIAVFDMQGKQVYATKEQDDTHHVKYSLLKQGVYFGIITLENGQQFSTKLVK